MKTVQIRNLTLGTGKPAICLPIVGRTFDDICGQAEEIKQNPVDIIEWRADRYDELQNITQLNKAADSLRGIIGDIPLLFTIRTSREGGECSMTFDAYRRILLEISRHSGIDAVDVEILTGTEKEVKSLISSLKKNAVVIASNHDFNKTPDVGIITDRLSYMDKCGADICKMAVMPKNSADVLTLLTATNEARNRLNCPIITMSMGKIGLISRISGESFGSALTFGCAGAPSAPGQIDAAELDAILNLLHKNL